MNTLETLQNILVEDFRVSRDGVTPLAELRSLGIDSLDVLDLLFKIEDAYGITIKDDTPTDLVTIGDVVTYIDRLLLYRAADAPPRAPSAAQAAGPPG